MNIEALGADLRARRDRQPPALPSGEIRTRTGRAQFEGVADLAEHGHVTLVARVRNGALPTPIGEPEHRAADRRRRACARRPRRPGIEVEQFSLMTPDGTASIIGQASLGGPTPGLSFALSFSKMPAAVVRALWPPFVADEDARLVRHQREGRDARARRRCRWRFRPITSGRAGAARCCRATRSSGRCRSRTASSRRSDLSDHQERRSAASPSATRPPASGRRPASSRSPTRASCRPAERR